MFYHRKDAIIKLRISQYQRGELLLKQDNNELIRQRLIDLRESNKMSQSELGRRANLDNSVISKIEAGTRKVSADELKRLSDIFNVTTDHLLGNNQAPEWATEKDTIDLGNFLNDNAKFAYNGSSLTNEEKEKLRIALTQIFWKRHKHGSDAHE